MKPQIIAAARLFDGRRFWEHQSLVIEGGTITALLPQAEAPKPDLRLESGLLTPAFLDLQVNGGGGIAVGAETNLESLRALCATHQRLGATGIFPTLISDSPAVTQRVIAAAVKAEAARLPGFLGLHLEGPHLDPARKGAHPAQHLRPMGESDLALLLAAKAQLRHLIVTLAPEAARPEQIATLTHAGVIVSLGHSGGDGTGAEAALAAGAQMVTHLFNAMAPFSARAPGLAGLALSAPVYTSLIGDGVHVAAPLLRLMAKAKGAKAILVSDAMALTGTAKSEMNLAGRVIRRQGARLTLEDGTLAGAVLSQAEALAQMIQKAGVPPAAALAMASANPAALLHRQDLGRLRPGARADLLLLDDNFTLRRRWQGGVEAAI